MTARFMVTTPIYYVNDRPHLGQAYTTIAADVLARFHRMAGDETFFLTGTDEHGSKVEETAKKLGKTPQELCDLNVEYFKGAWRSLNISYDYFVRTTDLRHRQAVVKLLDLLYATTIPDGEKAVYPGEYSGLYCLGCEKFVTEKDLVNGLCPDHLQEPKKITEKNYFFRLTSYLKQVEELIRTDQLKISPEERRKETLGLLRQELEDFSISREKVTWGIPLPFDPGQNAYVWVDALPNYISAIGYGDDLEKFHKWWRDGKVVHLIGKDILKFHAIFWPAMLLALGEKPPDEIFVHGFFTINGQKMSKTLGNVLYPESLVEKYGSDGARYLLLTQFPFGQDGDIQEERFVEKYNADLANDLGNLVSRTLKMVGSYGQGRIPKPSAYDQSDESIQIEATECGQIVWKQIQGINLNQAIDQVARLVRTTNRYVESQAPWALARDNKKERLETVLYVSCEVLRIISALFYPVLPQKCIRLRELLGLSDKDLIPTLEETREWGKLKAGTKVGIPQPLFPRLEKEVKEGKEKVDTLQENTVPELTFEEFSKLDLRVAEVKEAERVKGADKLLKLKIDLGSEERQIVAGIAEQYSPEEMVGKKIVVVANLKPAKIRGIESKGMLLAAKDGAILSLVSLDKEVKGGSKIS
ncbi:MAG: methionine--tRNA ligase [Candidatus Zixiibacteriota bacterium]